MNQEEITIRSIQHYMYCPHRWGLLEIDKAWAENAFVTKANLMHERVHNPDRHYAGRGKKVFTSVPVYNDLEVYQLYGIVDCLEVMEDSAGTFIESFQGNYALCIAEYKPTMPKNQNFREEDVMQVFAQKICTDYVFHTDCDGVIYYGDVKKRIKLPLKEKRQEYDMKLQTLLREMRAFLKIGKIPPIRKGQKCNGCSMRDLCMPSAKKTLNVKDEIQKLERTVL